MRQHRVDQLSMMKVATAAVLIFVLLVAFAGPAASAPAAKESFDITFDLTAGPPGIVVADGPITGQGMVFADERDTGNAFHEKETFAFPNGTLAVRANDVNTSTTFDAPTCTQTFAFKGNFAITAGSGSFATAKGHGHFSGESHISFLPDPASPQGCDLQQVIGGDIHGHAIGDVKL
jgi:hypothetical protein